MSCFCCTGFIGLYVIHILNEWVSFQIDSNIYNQCMFFVIKSNWWDGDDDDDDKCNKMTTWTK